MSGSGIPEVSPSAAPHPLPLVLKAAFMDPKVPWPAGPFPTSGLTPLCFSEEIFLVAGIPPAGTEYTPYF